DDAQAPGAEAGENDATARELLRLAAQNYPLVDYHVHLKSGLTLEQALERSRRNGIFCGIAINCGKGFPVQDEATARQFVGSMKGVPAFCAMQAEGREWVEMFSRTAVGLFDYAFTDSMTWTDNRGRRMRTWMPNEVGAIADPQEFMNTLVDRAVGILEREPIDIYVNPTFLPDQIAKNYDTLWTEERMRRVVNAMKKGDVAMEINDRYRLPSEKFIRMAKAEGLKFTFGTNNAGSADLRRCEYGLEMVNRCGLQWDDFFVPRPAGERGVDRKGGMLKS
ncbi:MAG: glycosyl hydrolase, partial [Acidobacteria bacterium]|nr:glycosyl hydrolase [Acidobacteriota bacterium]